MTDQLSVIDREAPIQIIPPQQLSVTDITNRAMQIQKLMQTMMKPGVHFGQIPGTKKNTLYKPGSEYLLMMFRIAIDPQVEELSDSEHVRFRVKCRGIALDGSFVGCGVGECSTAEEKYAWRKAVCKQEFEAADPTRRRVKWGTKDGQTYSVEQVRVNPADVSNTVLKMAKKRAQIDMTLTALGASDIFAQDLEDLAEELRDQITEEEKTHEPIKQPQCKSQPQAAAAPASPAPTTTQRVESPQNREPGDESSDLAMEATGTVDAVSKKTGKNSRGPWTCYGIKLSTGEWFNTFSNTDGHKAEEAKANRQPIKVKYTPTEKGNEVVSVEFL